ncbi:MAG: hypothetical protein ABIB41_09120, partial [Nitrospirota bacterium]
FINTNSLKDRHCEELSGCEAKPKQTRRFLVFTRNRLRNPRKGIATPFGLAMTMQKILLHYLCKVYYQIQ